MFYKNEEFYEKLSKILAVLTIIFLVIGLFKVIFYGNPGMNSYVGGDAYNYIINAGYFAGCMVASGSCMIGAFLSQIIVTILQSKQENQTEYVKQKNKNVAENKNWNEVNTK